MKSLANATGLIVILCTTTIGCRVHTPHPRILKGGQWMWPVTIQQLLSGQPAPGEHLHHGVGDQGSHGEYQHDSSQHQVYPGQQPSDPNYGHPQEAYPTDQNSMPSGEDDNLPDMPPINDDPDQVVELSYDDLTNYQNNYDVDRAVDSYRSSKSFYRAHGYAPETAPQTLGNQYGVYQNRAARNGGYHAGSVQDRGYQPDRQPTSAVGPSAAANTHDVFAEENSYPRVVDFGAPPPSKSKIHTADTNPQEKQDGEIESARRATIVDDAGGIPDWVSRSWSKADRK